jgi:non-ribosomal peptide synthetase component F
VRSQNIFEARQFWQNYLEGFSECTPIVSHYNLMTNDKTSYLHQSSSLSNEVTLSLQSLAQQHQITLSTLLQGMWALLLSRYTGKKDIIFGINISTRLTSLVRFDDTVGCFINTVPTRIQVPAEGPFLSYLIKHQDNLLDVLRYGYPDTEQIADWIAFNPAMPMFQSIFVWEDKSILESIKEKYDIDFLDTSLFIGDIEVPVRILAEGSSEGLKVTLSYNPRCFDPSQIEQMLNYFFLCLNGIAQHTDVDISLLPNFPAP